MRSVVAICVLFIALACLSFAGTPSHSPPSDLHAVLTSSPCDLTAPTLHISEPARIDKLQAVTVAINVMPAIREESGTSWQSRVQRTASAANRDVKRYHTVMQGFAIGALILRR
jgi:hypothetical protein